MRIWRALHYLGAVMGIALLVVLLRSAVSTDWRTLSPNPISADTVSVALSVEGSAFVPQSQILWNQNLFPTTSSIHVTRVTQEIFESYGGSAGKMYRFTVTSPGSTYVVGCANGGTSSTLLLRLISGPIGPSTSFKPIVVGVPIGPPSENLAGLFCPPAVEIACLSRS